MSRHKNFLDKFVEGKDKKEILYMHLAVILLIGFIIYYFIYPISASFKKNQEDTYNQNISTLESLKSKKNVYTMQVVSLTKVINKLNLTKTSLQKQKMFFNDLVSLLDFAQFDKYKWAAYVKNVVEDAKNEGLTLLDFANTLYDNQAKSFVNKKMDILVNIKGNYKNFISYIYKYENTKELIRVSEINGSDKGVYMIKYSLYGYKQ
jgi:hypothetical protein